MICLKKILEMPSQSLNSSKKTLPSGRKKKKVEMGPLKNCELSQNELEIRIVSCVQ